MSIYIPGISKPTSCYDCPCANGDRMRCQVAKRDFGFFEGTRPGWCPLIPVPEHGRLGDLDALMQKDNDDYNIALLLTTDDEVQSIITRLHIQMQRVLMGAPTIIPADPVKEGE